MINKSALPWEEINEFILELENIRSKKLFYEIFLNNIHKFISYDQARLYEKNINGKITESLIIKVDDWWNDAYVRFYSQISKDINNKIIQNRNDCVYEQYRIVTWKDYEKEDFFSDYIKPQGIKYTLGFSIHNNNFVADCGLDRTSGEKFSKQETEMLRILHGHIQILYENLEYYKENSRKESLEFSQLTNREKEIVTLLIKGMKPINISNSIFISLPTVYRHIANIYSKLGISTIQELVIKFLENQEVKNNNKI